MLGSKLNLYLVNVPLFIRSFEGTLQSLFRITWRQTARCLVSLAQIITIIMIITRIVTIAESVTSILPILTWSHWSTLIRTSILLLYDCL